MSTPASGEFAHIGKSVVIKGELSGSEDIYVDGQVEGNIHLGGNNLTIGPHGRVRANITAKNVTIGGTLDGNITASERTELRKSAVTNGDVQTKRIAIEEGAFFKGKLEIVGNAASAAASGSAESGK
jgi:cytoskeletal protein CcmA (bactofilin family)